MYAMRCDRCGEFYIPYGPQREVYNSNGIALTLKMPNGTITPNLHLDLCPNCIMDTVAFMMLQDMRVPSEEPPVKEEKPIDIPKREEPKKEESKPESKKADDEEKKAEG